jgi:hypothetical protein
MACQKMMTDPNGTKISPILDSLPQEVSLWPEGPTEGSRGVESASGGRNPRISAPPPTPRQGRLTIEPSPDHFDHGFHGWARMAEHHSAYPCPSVKSVVKPSQICLILAPFLTDP